MMAVDITKLPESELLEDREASITDISICEIALIIGLTHIDESMTTQQRLDINKSVIEKIDAELNRRKTE